MANESTQSSKAVIKRRRADGRAVYEFESKLAIVRAATMPGASVAKVSLEHGVNANLVRKWIVKHGRQAADTAQPTATMLPVVIDQAQPVAKATTPRRRDGAGHYPIEIDLAGATLRLYGPIERSMLRELIEVLARR